MLSQLNRHIILPLYLRRHKDKRIERMKELEKLQWLSSDELQARQLNKLKALVAYAYENVAFYQEQYKAIGFQPGDLKELEDFKKLPTLTKNDIQNNLKKLTSRTFSDEQLLKDSSGGSTGVPTVFYTDKNNRDLRRGAALLSDSWSGWKVGEMSSYLWGADRDTNIIRSYKAKIVHKLIHRTSLLNAFELDESTMLKHVQTLKREKPTLIIAYANVAYFFSKFLIESDISVPSPKGIVCSAETLTDEKRQVIESAFGCKALNRYASREIGLIAAECPLQNGLHINSEDVFVEIEQDDTNEFGEIIVTDFNNHAMPFIRYRTGDVGVVSNDACDCGRGLPLIKEVKGRTSDFILHPDGHLIHGESFSHAFYAMPEVARFQIHQKNINTLDVNIITRQSFSTTHKNLIEKKIQEITGSDVMIMINEVEDIPLPVSGKFKFAISDIIN